MAWKCQRLGIVVYGKQDNAFRKLVCCAYLLLRRAVRISGTITYDRVRMELHINARTKLTREHISPYINLIILLFKKVIIIFFKIF